MSSRAHSSFVLEWSPKTLIGYDAATQTTRSFASVADVAGATRDAIVAVSRRLVFIRSLRVPDVSPEEVRQVLALRLNDLFPVATQDLAIDFELTNNVSPEGRLAMVAAIPVAELTRIYAECRSAGLRVVRVVPSALSSAMIDATAAGTSAVVQETVDGIAIDVIADGGLRQSRITNLPQQLQNEVCRTFGIAGLECGTILSAGGLALPFADAVVKESGLEILQKNQDRLHMNLELPEEVAARQKASRASKQRLALLFLVASLGIGAYVFLDYQEAMAKFRSVSASNEKRIRILKENQDQLTSNLTTWATLQKSLDRAYRPAQRFSDVMTILSNRTPQGVWLTGMTVERGKEFSVRGTATSNEAMNAYLDSLSGEQRFRNVRLVFSNNAEIEQTGVVQFSLAGFPTGNLPLFDTVKGRKR